MLSDVVGRKRTEVEGIHGALLREASRLGVPVPVNKTVYNLIKTIEHCYERQIGTERS